MSVNNLVNIVSQAQIKAQTMMTATATTAVSTANSRRVAQETLFISAMTSSMNFFGLNPASDAATDAFSSAKTCHILIICRLAGNHFVSLCSVCFLQNLQYLLSSRRSGWFFLFLFVW